MLRQTYRRIHGLFNALALFTLAIFRKKVEFPVMRFLLPVAAIATAALGAAGADARGLERHREQDAAYRAMQQGEILPLPVIRSRVRVPGAQFIGAEFDGRIYRLKFMRGGEVIYIDVDARTGRPIR